MAGDGGDHQYMGDYDKFLQRRLRHHGMPNDAAIEVARQLQQNEIPAGVAGKILSAAADGSKEWIDLPAAQQLFRGDWVAASSRLITGMTGDNAPAPYSASSPNQVNAWRLFDGTTTGWQSFGTSGIVVTVDLGSSQRLDHYSFLAPQFEGPRAPKDWILEASNDAGVTWTTIDTRSGVTFTNGQKLDFAIANPAAYRRFRLTTSANGGDANYTGLDEWELWQDQDSPYMAGEYVTHNGRMWASVADNNTDEPGTTTTWAERAELPGRSGTTANRPSSGLTAGYQYFDTTLGKPIWSNGTGWVDATGTTA